MFCFPFQQKSRCIKLVTDVGFRLMTIRDVVPMKSKPALFSLYCASLSFTGPVTEEDPLVVALKHGRYTPEMIAIQATRGFGLKGQTSLRRLTAHPKGMAHLFRPSEYQEARGVSANQKLTSRSVTHFPNSR